MEFLLLPLSHYTHVRSRIQQHTLRHYVLCGLAASFLMIEENKDDTELPSTVLYNRGNGAESNRVNCTF